MLFEIVWTIAAAAAVWWTVFRLPGFWRRPRPVDLAQISFRPENQTRAVPAVAVLWTPLAVALAVVGWVQPDDDPDGVAPWLQDVFVVSISVSVVACLVVAASGHPRFALPPSLRGSDYREVALHDTTVHELAGGGAPFFATCACGWNSDHHATEDAARAEAGGHSDHVLRVLDRMGAERPAR